MSIEPLSLTRAVDATGYREEPAVAISCDSVVPAPDSLSRLVACAARQMRPEAAHALQIGAIHERIESPEALSAFAARFDLELVLEPRSVESLGPHDFPVIMVTEAAEGRLLLDRRADVFTGVNEEAIYRIHRDLLTAEEAGVLFLVRARGSSETGPQDQARSDPASPNADAGQEDPVRGVIHYLMTAQRPLMFQLMISAAFSNLMLLALPVYIGLVFDRVIPHSAFDTLWAVSLGVLIALGADFAVRWVRLKIQDALASSASSTLQAVVVRRFLEVRMVEAPRSAGAVTMRLREIDSLSQLIPQLITGVTVDIPFLALVFALIWLNGGVVVFAPLAGILILLLVQHLSDQKVRAEQARSARLGQMQTNHIIEAVEGLEAIKSTRTERRVLGRFERVYDEYAYSSHISRLWYGAASYASVTISQAISVLVVVIAVYEISNGAMTVGGLSSCILLVGRVTSPVGQLISVFHRVFQSRTLLKTLSEYNTGSSEVGGDRSGMAMAPREGSIRLENVSFCYSGHTADQISDISLTVRPGERVAIIGRSGSGKSTLLKMLTGLLDPVRGAVLIDDMDARQYDRTGLRRVLGFMGQGGGAVDESLLANLTLGVDRVDQERMQEILRLTGVTDFAARHPKGYSMLVGPRGERLSGGERQCVALARLLLADPRVLILDEPTSAMDTLLEARIVRDLKSYLGDRTLIVATHRAPILDLVTRLVWLENGRLVADGPKEEVLKRMAGANH